MKAESGDKEHQQRYELTSQASEIQELRWSLLRSDARKGNNGPTQQETTGGGRGAGCQEER